MKLLLLSVLLFAGYALADPISFTVRHAGKVEQHQSHTKEGRADANAPAVSIDGTLEILHEDYAGGKGVFHYRVRDKKNKVTELNIDSLPHHVRGGSKVRVHGKRTAKPDQIDPDTIDVQAEPLALTTTNVTSIYILIYFTGQSGPNTTQAAVQAEAAKAVAFYAENSYGKESMTPTVTPALQSPVATPTGCDTATVQTEGDKAATAAGYNVSSYTYRAYIFSLPCNFLGAAYVGSPKIAWIKYPVAQVITHEQGHNHGLLHAGSVQGVGPRTASEYGDQFDTMGNQAMGHYDAAQKVKLGWLNPGQYTTYASGTVTYTLSPFELTGGSTYAVKIPTPLANRTYWLEYRTPNGFDNLPAMGTGGVQVRLAQPLEAPLTSSDDTLIIPPDGAANWFLNRYTDPNYPITMTLVSSSPTSAVVQVGGASTGLPTPSGLHLSP